MLAEAREQWAAEGHRDMRADTLTNAALWTAISGDLPTAVGLSDEACALAAQTGNWWVLGYSSSARAQILVYQGRYAEALPASERGWEASIKAGLIGAAAMASGLGATSYLALGQPDKAVALARAGVEVTEDRIPVFASICRGRLSLALLAAGDVDGAAAVFAGNSGPHMSEHSLKLDHEAILAPAFVDLARGNAVPLEVAARSAVARAQRHAAQTHVPGFLVAHARALVALGRDSQARAQLDDAARLARRLGVRSILWQALGGLAQLETRGSDAAAAYLSEARAEVEWLAAPLPDDLRASFLARPEVRRITQPDEPPADGNQHRPG
jgi:tetratricopeptide (TPR) repeat protein